MNLRFVSALVFALALTTAVFAQNAPADGQNPNMMPGYGPLGGGMGMMMGSAIAGTVTEAASDHFTIKTFRGATYTIHFDANTRILKQTAGAGRGYGMGRGMGMRPRAGQPIPAGDIKVGDALAANGEVDVNGRSVAATDLILLDPQRAQHMQQMQADYGTTWLMGRVTAIDGAKITIAGALDSQTYTLTTDANTGFHQRRRPIALTDIQVGDMVRAEGALKGDAFAATLVNVMRMPPAARLPRNVPPQ